MEQKTTERRRIRLFALCGLLILFDGFDLTVYGAILPDLLKQKGWGMTPAMAARAGSLTLFGMMVGALIAGTLCDRIGRRKVVLASVAGFSLMMIASGLAPSFLVFEVTRTLAGIGLGALLPTITALILEFSPPEKRASSYTLSFIGYLLGAMASGLLAALILQNHGWRPVLMTGGLPILLLPLVMALLPESPEWLAANGQQQKADEICKRYGLPPIRQQAATQAKPRIAELFTKELAPVIVISWGVHFCALMLTYGMANWLPTIMSQLGYDIRSALSFGVVLNAGAIIGVLFAARIADRGNTPVVVAVLYLIGTMSIMALTAVQSTAALYVLIAISGLGTIGAQILANVLVASLYPARIRGTGLGFSLCVGRIGGILGPAVGGFVLTYGLVPQWNFYVFALIACLGSGFAGLAVMLRRGQRDAGGRDQTA
jgi:AAHS family benzoate transporter-like MFS transporter